MIILLLLEGNILLGRHVLKYRFAPMSLVICIASQDRCSVRGHGSREVARERERKKWRAKVEEKVGRVLFCSKVEIVMKYEQD